jgi:hypothetical protein
MSDPVIWRGPPGKWIVSQKGAKLGEFDSFDEAATFANNPVNQRFVEVVLETIRNQHGDTIPFHWLEIDKQAQTIHEKQIACRASDAFDLGTCRCSSHPAVTAIRLATF